MKNKSLISLVLLLAGVLFAASSCSDMLTPDLERYSEKNGQDSLYSYLGILKSVQKIVERDVILGEARGDLVTTTKYTSDSVNHIFNFDDQIDGETGFLQTADYYNVINQCNFYLHYADTTLVQDQVKYMEKEWAQVQAVRAWTYMQLVQNYGSVPFVTEPVSNTSQGINYEKNATRATKDNLVDLLLKAGLQRAYELQDELGYPSYSTYNNGNVSIPSRSCYIPAFLITADLYLMKNDYENAASMYYKFMRKEAAYVPANRAGFGQWIAQDGTYYYPISQGWEGRFSSYSTGSGSDLITLIPGAASKSQGNIFTQVQNIYGFKTSSAGGTNSGYISLTPNEKYMQLTPSTNYFDLNAEQVYCNYTSSSGSEVQEFYKGAGDARVHCAAPYYRIDGVDYRFISKFAPCSINYNGVMKQTYGDDYSTYYAIQIYRKALVHLRFAEAINRAGYPEHAFSILKDGIASDNYPTLKYKDSIAIVTKNDTSATGKVTIDTLKIDTIKDIPYLVTPVAETGGAYYISVAEMQKAAGKTYLDFTDTKFNNSPNYLYGIHGLGSGDTRGYHDSLYTYNVCVAQKVAEKRATDQGKDTAWQHVLADSLAKVGIDKAVVAGTITKDEVTDAVENLIIDELALETAFEGNRYYDLMRFANHKGNGALDNEWLAKKIASRGYAPGMGYDATLYNKLVGGTRWYLSLPTDK